MGGSLHGNFGELRLCPGQGQRLLFPPPRPGREVRGPWGRLHVRRVRRGPRLGAELRGGELPAQGRGSVGWRR
eukprot:15464967-Alexandrium_andersonii.AAC.1